MFIWAPTVGNEINFRQESGNEEDSYAVAVYGYSESSAVLGHLPCELSHLSFFFEHNGIVR